MAESLDEREEVIHQMFSLFDKDGSGSLEAPFVQAAHEMIRMGGISVPQVQASMGYVCVDPDVCEEWEFIELLKEMDRRYYLVQNFRWEFSLLDHNSTDTISEEQARWFLQSVHGQYFSRERWDRFIKSRPAPSTGVSFSEIEVELCNIPCMTDVLDELQDEKKKKEAKKREEEEKRKLKLKLEEDRKRMLEQLEESQRQQQDEKRKQGEEDEAERKRLEAEEARKLEEEKERRRLEQEEEERKRRENEEMLERLKREEEERKRREEEEARSIEIIAHEAEEAEKAAKKEADEATEKLKRAEDAKTKQELEDLHRDAKKREKESKEKKIRANMKVSIKTRKKDPIKKSLGDFKKTKLEDYDGDVPKAEKILKLLEVKEGLSKAMAKRDIKELEEVMNLVRRGGYETELQREMIEANQLLMRLRRLERIRAEILELKQSTVAEIRSYQVPPDIVHYVMIGTFLLLGHQEKECKEWKKVQALVGKTGKEGLKRRCLEYDPSNLAKKLELANKAKNRMATFELDDVRDVSAGAATFYLWAMNMIEEAEDIASQVETE